MSTALKPKPEPREWVAQHCEMIDAISFPVRFEIMCTGCGDTMEEVEHKTLIRIGKVLLVWHTANMECENCGQGQEEDEDERNDEAEQNAEYECDMRHVGGKE